MTIHHSVKWESQAKCLMQEIKLCLFNAKKKKFQFFSFCLMLWNEEKSDSVVEIFWLKKPRNIFNWIPVFVMAIEIIVNQLAMIEFIFNVYAHFTWSSNYSLYSITKKKFDRNETTWWYDRKERNKNDQPQNEKKKKLKQTNSIAVQCTETNGMKKKRLTSNKFDTV